MKAPTPPDDFEALLRRDAALARQRVAPSDDLAPRIAREVRLSRIPAAPARQRRGWLLPSLSFAGAAACAAWALVLLRPEPTASPLEPRAAVATTSSPSAAWPNPVAVWSALRPDANALLARNPLESEVDALVNDGRKALRFLALNFLPAAPEADEPRSG